MHFTRVVLLVRNRVYYQNRVVNMTDTCIIVLGYNRFANLQNLVSQISEQTDLTINLFLDFYNENFIELCRSDSILKHCTIHTTEENIGLKNNVLRAFEFARDYKNVFVFEDDLVISTGLFQTCEIFTQSSIRYHSFAQLSFHLPKVNEFTGETIEFYFNERATVPIQVPTSWGFLTTGKVIRGFTNFISSQKGVDYDALPAQCMKWGCQSWKLLFFDYMVKQGLYTYYPYATLSVPAALTVGTHRSGSDFHVSGSVAPVPILLDNNSYDVNAWHYDQFFEPRGTVMTEVFGPFDEVRLSQVQRSGEIGPNMRVLTATKANHILGVKYPLATKPIEANAFLQHTVTPVTGVALGVVQNYPKFGQKIPILANIDFGNPQIYLKFVKSIITKLFFSIMKKIKQIIKIRN